MTERGGVGSTRRAEGRREGAKKCLCRGRVGAASSNSTGYGCSRRWTGSFGRGPCLVFVARGSAHVGRVQRRASSKIGGCVAAPRSTIASCPPRGRQTQLLLRHTLARRPAAPREDCRHAPAGTPVKDGRGCHGEDAARGLGSHLTPREPGSWAWPGGFSVSLPRYPGLHLAPREPRNARRMP